MTSGWTIPPPESVNCLLCMGNDFVKEVFLKPTSAYSMAVLNMATKQVAHMPWIHWTRYCWDILLRWYERRFKLLISGTFNIFKSCFTVGFWSRAKVWVEGTTTVPLFKCHRETHTVKKNQFIYMLQGSFVPYFRRVKEDSKHTYEKILRKCE